MQLKQNKKFASKVLDEIINAYLSEEREDEDKWHVYDLLFPRKTYACELYGCKPTREDVGFFFLGKAIHREVQRILGEKNAEVKATKHGVVGTMDYKEKRSGIEIKSSRKWTIPDSPEDYHIKQAGYYTVVHDLDTVNILVIYPTAGRTWNGKKSSTIEVRCWTLTFSPQEKKAIEYDIKRSIEELEKAIRKKNPNKLPPAPDWILERFNGKVPGGEFKERYKELAGHPFYYAYTEKGLL